MSETVWSSVWTQQVFSGWTEPHIHWINDLEQKDFWFKKSVFQRNLNDFDLFLRGLVERWQTSPCGVSCLRPPVICLFDRCTGLMGLCAGVQFLLCIFYTVCVFFRAWMCACRTFVTVCHSMLNKATSVLVFVSWNRDVQTPQFDVITSVWAGLVSASCKWNVIYVT